MMCLELFAGTGSIGRAFERLGWTVVSVDICAKWKPTLMVDIFQWHYTCFPRDYLQFVWASPVCTQYSIAQNGGRPESRGFTAGRGPTLVWPTRQQKRTPPQLEMYIPLFPLAVAAVAVVAAVVVAATVLVSS